MQKGNLFEAIPERLPQELLQTLLKTPDCRIERIVSRGHVTPNGQWYDQAWDEWVVLLQGRSELEFEDGETIRLVPGDWLAIPAHCRHRVIFTDTEQDTLWIAVHLAVPPSHKQP